MVRTVTRKTPSAATTWYRIGKSANKRVKKSSSSRRKELVKLRSMKKVTKRVLDEKLKRAYVLGRDGMYSRRNFHMNKKGEILSCSNCGQSTDTINDICEHRLCEDCFDKLTKYRPCPQCNTLFEKSDLENSFDTEAEYYGQECSVCERDTGKQIQVCGDPICEICFNNLWKRGGGLCPKSGCNKKITKLIGSSGTPISSPRRPRRLVPPSSYRDMRPRDNRDYMSNTYVTRDGSLKACPPGKTRSRKGHCVKIWSRSPRRKSLNPGYELNRKTGRLRKVCPSGKKRSRKGRCKKI